MYVRIYYTGGLIIWTSTFLIKRMVYGMSCREIIISLALLYDTRNILTPSELTEGGRRLYSEEDLKRMKIICFLRDAGISINSIGELLSEHDPGRTTRKYSERRNT